MGCAFAFRVPSLSLLTTCFQRVHGWRTAKRPGVDYFLAYLSQFYEIVLFTSQPLYVSLCGPFLTLNNLLMDINP